MNKKTIKRLGAVALVSMLALGASAWLTNRETASGTTHIKTATLNEKVYFAGQSDPVITLTDNTAIPMTREYAVDNNTIYTFDIQNDAVFAVDYQITVDKDSFSNTFEDGAAKLVLVKVAEDADEAAIKAALKAGAIQDVPEKNDDTSFIDFETVHPLASGAKQKYAFVLYLDGSVANNPTDYYTGRALSLTLRVNSQQAAED